MYNVTAMTILPYAIFCLFTLDSIISDSTVTMRNQKRYDHHHHISGIAVDILCAQRAVHYKVEQHDIILCGY